MSQQWGMNPNAASGPKQPRQTRKNKKRSRKSLTSVESEQFLRSVQDTPKATRTPSGEGNGLVNLLNRFRSRSKTHGSSSDDIAFTTTPLPVDPHSVPGRRSFTHGSPSMTSRKVRAKVIKKGKKKEGDLSLSLSSGATPGTEGYDSGSNVSSDSFLPALLSARGKERDREAPSSSKVADIPSSAVKFIRRSLTHREESALSSPRENTSKASAALSEEEELLLQVHQHLLLHEELQGHTKADRAVQLWKERSANTTTSKEQQVHAQFYHACAHYQKARLCQAQSDLLALETHLRESLHLLDGLLLHNKTSRTDSNPSLSSGESKDWLPTSHSKDTRISRELIWLRRADVEELLGQTLVSSKKKLAAAEWFERANYSREQANQSPSLSVSCALATIVVELIAFHMEQYHLVHQSGLVENEQERLRTLNFPLHLERSRIALKEAIKPCKHQALARDAHCILLRVLMVTVDFIALERELGMPASSIPTPLKVLHNKMDKERKEIRRLEKKLHGKTGSEVGSPLYTLGMPLENSSGHMSMSQLQKSPRNMNPPISKPSLSDSRLEMSTVPKLNPALTDV